MEWSKMSREDRQIYYIWYEMHKRCENPAHRQYKDYGGRGISVCKEWSIFDTFRSDMGPRPPGSSLERSDNDRGYEPINCRWATRKEQNSNRRNCIYVKHRDEIVTLKEYCRREKLPYRPIVKRIQDRHWPLDAALSIPVGTGKHFLRSNELEKMQ